MTDKWSDNKSVDGWDHEGWHDHEMNGGSWDARKKSFVGTNDIEKEWQNNANQFEKNIDRSYLKDALQVLHDCGELMKSKGKDYQGGSVQDPDYYPHGWKSFDTMLTTKILRFRSIMDQKGEVNYDSAEDCLRDLINYSARCVVWLERNK